jgi:hypothetical protein
LRALLVDPAKQLGGTEALLAQALTKNGQTVEIKVKQVGRHVCAVMKLPKAASPFAS